MAAQMVRPQGRFIIAMSFFVALILTVVPMPGWLAPVRPEWVAIVLLYWCIALPDRVGVGIAWILGLLLDVLQGAIFGQHALALSIMVFLAIKVHKQIRVYPMWQQALSVLILVMLNQMLVLWIKGIIGVEGADWRYWLPTLSSALLWPWLFVILRDMRRHFGVR